MTGKYESMVIFAPNLPADEIDKENKKIIALVEENGGVLVKTDVWGKKQLAYEINKFRDGYYIINYFHLDTLKIDVIKRHYSITERIIRHNVLKLEAQE